MSRNNNQPPREPDMVYMTAGQLHTEDGALTHGTLWKKEGISHDQAREALAEARDVDPDQIIFGHEASPELAAAVTAERSLRRRMSVGFSKWNSSWDPDKEREERRQREQQIGGDPNMN